jgi:hypothetical protein
VEVWMSSIEFEKIMTDTDETIHIEDDETGTPVCGATTGRMYPYIDERIVTCQSCLAD